MPVSPAKIQLIVLMVNQTIINAQQSQQLIINSDHRMEKSSRDFLLKCIGGNAAGTVCAEIGCTRPSLMCSDEDCKCIASHSSCSMLSTVKKLQNIIETKGKSHLAVYSRILNWYQSQMKMMRIEMEDLQSKIDDSELVLSGNEQKLHSYLQEGRSELVVPSLMAVVINASKKQDLKQSSKQSGCLDELVGYQNQVKQIVSHIKKMSEVEALVVSIDDIGFTSDLTHNDITIVNNHIIKTEYPRGRYKAAVFLPSIPQRHHNTCKVKLRVKNTLRSQIMMGVLQIPATFNMRLDVDIYNKMLNGSLTHFINGKMYLGKVKEHKVQSNNTQKVAANDVVEVQYQRGTHQVRVSNVTNNTKSESYIVVDQTLPLYFAVILLNQSDQVQIMGIETF